MSDKPSPSFTGSETLLPCPFCGCEGQKFKDFWDSGTIDCFGCKDCGISFERAEEWNRREVSDGYVLMPREATRVMTMAGCDCLPSCEHVFGNAGEILRNAYAKMVEVCSPPPQPVDAAQAEALRRYPVRDPGDYGIDLNKHSRDCFIEGYSAAPQPAGAAYEAKEPYWLASNGSVSVLRSHGSAETYRDAGYSVHGPFASPSVSSTTQNTPEIDNG